MKDHAVVGVVSFISLDFIVLAAGSDGGFAVVRHLDSRLFMRRIEV